MKNLIYRIIIGAVAFIFIYLLGCFFEASFNISQWDAFTRSMVVLWGGGAFIMCVVLGLVAYSED